MRRLLLPTLILLVTVACTGARLRARDDLGAFEARSGARTTVRVPMRDGVALHTVVHLPAGSGPWPVVLTRTPYAMAPILDQRCALLNRYGYACVWQHVRGRVASEGAWVPFEHERDDGLDTFDWLRSQPWQDGRWAMLGESYMAGVQWAVAEVLPPEVRTLIPSVFGTSAYDGVYERGLWRHELITAWMALTAPKSVLAAPSAYRRALAHRPRGTMDEASVRQRVDWFRTWASHPDPDDAYWHRPQAVALEEAPARVRVPVLMIGGWADAFLGGQLTDWARLATAERSALVIGPWNHLGGARADVPVGPLDVDEGLDGRMTQWQRVLDWLDHHLRDRPLAHPAGRVVTWVHGEERWAAREAWPPPTEPRTLFLAPGDDPVACTGALAEEPSAPGAVGYTYDPADPTPSRGGAGLLLGALPGFGGVPPGLRDQRGLCLRPDVLGFVSAPLDAPLHVAGSFAAVLEVASSAADTAFGFRVVERLQDGRDIELREALTALSLRDGRTRQPYTPGERVEVRLETWPIEHVFRPGSRIVVQVASASFPKVEAHPNRVTAWHEALVTEPAAQTLALGSSRVELPVVPTR